MLPSRGAVRGDENALPRSLRPACFTFLAQSTNLRMFGVNKWNLASDVREEILSAFKAYSAAKGKEHAILDIVRFRDMTHTCEGDLSERRNNFEIENIRHGRPPWQTEECVPLSDISCISLTCCLITYRDYYKQRLKDYYKQQSLLRTGGASGTLAP